MSKSARARRHSSRWMPENTPNIGIVGMGYVGLPLAVAFAREGCTVTAVDLGVRKIAQLKAGESYIEDVDASVLREVAGRIHAGTSYAPLALTDAILICVPTPLSRNR